MNIVVSGGTGFIGRPLCESLLKSGHRLTMLTRNQEQVSRLFGPTMTAVEWNGRETGDWEGRLEGAEAVVNLAGASIADARWTDARKRLITESRIMSARCLVQACSRLAVKPHVFLNASAIGYYGPQGDQVLDESSRPGIGFLADLCVQWESAARDAASNGMRVVCLRTGMVLERDGGALPRMAIPFRCYMGGPVMPGTQWVSWIHRDDVVGLIEWALTNAIISGPVNAVAPHAVRMTEFCRTLGRVLHRPSWIPVPALVLKTALGELGSLMTTGQRVAPMVAQQGGYRFQYPRIEEALRAALTRA
ncbi:MAG: TIGR01777 family oxidoreductase [Nitrospirales bacterium]